jgi:phosphoglycolate phosphatase-like HAD superfamily hydrolase
VATSASKEDLTALLTQANLADLLMKKTTSDDVANSKPDADIVLAALKKSGTQPAQALMIGDTPYDIVAAARAGVKSLAFTCGGWKKEELKDAFKIYESPLDLLEKFDQSPLSGQYER